MVATSSSPWLGLGLCLVAVPLVAHAAPAARQALVPVVIGDVSKAVLGGLEDFVMKARKFYPSNRVRVGREVKEPFKKAVLRCGDDLGCIAKLSAREKLAEVILVRVRQEADGVSMAFVAVDAAAAKVTRIVTMQIAKPEDAQAAVAANFFEILGISTPGYLVVPNAPAGGEVDGKPAELAGKVELSPGLHLVRVDGREAKTMILPGETQTLELKELAVVAAPSAPIVKADVVHNPEPTPAKPAAPPRAEPVESVPPPRAMLVAAAAPAPEPVAATSVTDEGGGLPDGLLSYVGYGFAGLGAIAAIAGGYYATQIEVRPSSKASQARVSELNRDARAAARRANQLFGVGGGLVAVGAALWAVDTFVVSADAAGGVAVIPTRGGAALGLRLSF